MNISDALDVYISSVNIDRCSFALLSVLFSWCPDRAQPHMVQTLFRVYLLYDDERLTPSKREKNRVHLAWIVFSAVYKGNSRSQPALL